jgi:hypothetical protein
MALKINQSETFSWPVKVSIPRDGGGYETGSFDAVFKRLPRSESEALANKVMAGELDGIDAVRQILVGWTGVKNGDDDVPFSETNREALLEIQGVAIAVFRVFTEAAQGAGATKN